MEQKDEDTLNGQMTRPPWANSSPIGDSTLDQKIASATTEDIVGLEGEIATITNGTIRTLQIKALAAKFKIPYKTVEADVNALRQESQSEINITQTEISAHFDNLIDLALDDEERVVYLVKCPHMFIDGEYSITWEASHSDGNRTLIPPPRKLLPFKLVKAVDVFEFYCSGRDSNLLKDISQYFSRFSSLTPGQNLVITLYTFATYLQDHPDVHYLAVIFFYGNAERGKSRTGKAATYIFYRGIHLLNMREANIFRFSEDLQATTFFDMKNVWQQAIKNNCEDILLGRFEKGSFVARVLFPEKGPFEDTRFFKIFGPTIAASNEPLHKILDTRTITVNMLDKPGTYEQPIPEMGLELKARLTAWRAHMIGRELPQVEEIPNVIGRIWDVSRTLLQICTLECPEAIPTLQQYIQEVAAERTQDNNSSYEAQIVNVIRNLSPTDVQEWKVSTIDVVNNLNQGRSPEFYSHVGPTGKKLRNMGFNIKTINGKSVIFLNRQDLDIRLIQYGLDPMLERQPMIKENLDTDSFIDGYPEPFVLT
jgi:hypothetical protein